MQKFKVGDTVHVKNLDEAWGNCVIIEVQDFGSISYQVQFPQKGKWWYFQSELEPVKKFKVGDKVVYQKLTLEGRNFGQSYPGIVTAVLESNAYHVTLNTGSTLLVSGVLLVPGEELTPLDVDDLELTRIMFGLK